MRGSLSIILLVASLFLAGAGLSGETGLSIRLDSYADRRTAEVSPRLFSLPPQEWCARYKSESIVYVPGETAHITVKISEGNGAPDGEITVAFLVSGESRVLYHGPLSAGRYGPYDVKIKGEFEVYQVRVQAGDRTARKGFYGIRPRRGMRGFSEAVSPYRISLAYEKTAGGRREKTTPWDVAAKEKAVPLDALDANWALASHVGEASSVREKWWLWTHYACGMVGLEGARTGLFWGQYNPWVQPVPLRFKGPQNAARTNQQFTISLPPHFTMHWTQGMLPCGIYFRERIQPVLQEWAANVAEKHPDSPLTIALGDDWSVSGGIARRFGPETLRYFVSWMKQHFDISIRADTFKELIQKCEQYPKHFAYFVARNTTLRSLELTCEAVQDVVTASRAWDKNGESNRELIALPEAGEFCEILARCIGVGTSDDERAWHLTHGNPLPYSMSNMVVKAFAPEHNFCVGWNGCGQGVSDGEIHRWYLEPAWITAYDSRGKVRHLYTHSPPTGSDGVWRFLIEDAHAPDEKIRVHDKCFQLMEAIGVEKPVGPVFVCKDWTFADARSGKAFRSDLYEKFLISLRRHKVPISSAVHADYESKLPADLARIYAPRMNGPDRIRFGFRAGSVEKWFDCEASGIPDSLVADLAADVNSAGGDPIVFPPDSSIEGYAFETGGMKLIVAEEMAGRKEHAQIKVKVRDGRWKAIDIIAAETIPSRKQGEYLIFEASLDPNSATLYCLINS